MDHTVTAVVQTTVHVSTTLTLWITTCPNCGIVHGITEDLKARRLAQGGNVYCPNGHTWIFTTTEVDKQRKRADTAEVALQYARAARDAARDQAAAAERSAAAYRGHLTRMRNRIANGVCPVQGCRRNFTNVKAHVTSQHPEWAHEHPEALT